MEAIKKLSNSPHIIVSPHVHALVKMAAARQGITMQRVADEKLQAALEPRKGKQ